MDLTEDEVVQILKWVEESKFDEFNLEVDDLKLRVSKTGNFIDSQEEKLPASPDESTEFPAPAIEKKDEVLSFIRRQVKNTRLSTKAKAEKFLRENQ